MVTRTYCESILSMSHYMVGIVYQTIICFCTWTRQTSRSFKEHFNFFLRFSMLCVRAFYFKKKKKNNFQSTFDWIESLCVDWFSTYKFFDHFISMWIVCDNTFSGKWFIIYSKNLINFQLKKKLTKKHQQSNAFVLFDVIEFIFRIEIEPISLYDKKKTRQPTWWKRWEM